MGHPQKFLTKGLLLFSSAHPTLPYPQHAVHALGLLCISVLASFPTPDTELRYSSARSYVPLHIRL